MSQHNLMPPDPALKKLGDKINSDVLAMAWRRMAKSVGQSAFELTPEEFAPIRQTYDAMRRRGTTFDPMLVSLIECLTRQAMRGDDGIDGNGDEHDELFDERLDWTASRPVSLAQEGDRDAIR